MNHDPNQPYQQYHSSFLPEGGHAWASDAHGQRAPSHPAYDAKEFHAGTFEMPQEFEVHRHNKNVAYWKRIGGGSLAISLAVHGVFLLIAVYLISLSYLASVKPSPLDFEVPGSDGSSASNTLQKDRNRRSIALAQPKMRTTARVEHSSVVLPDPPVIVERISAFPISMPVAGGMGAGQAGMNGRGKRGRMGGGDGDGAGSGKWAGLLAEIPKIMRSRCNPKERELKMRENGGTPDCEAAVVKSLDWFATTQNSDGSWGKDWKAGMTGLVLLCYYGHCETPESPRYGDKIMKGITYLLNVGQKNAGFFSERLGTSNHCVYEHGIACYALGETYSFAKLGNRAMPGLRDGFQNGVEIILDHQQENGNWSYDNNSPHYAKYGREDMSVTGWQFQALRAAEHTALKIGGLKSGMIKAAKYLESRSQPEGGIGHNGADRNGSYSQWTMSGIGALGLQTLGGSSHVANKAIKFIMEETDKAPLEWQKNGSLYCWYYNTQAIFQRGGKDWEVWNRQFRDQVLTNQTANGTYHPESSEHRHATSAAAGSDAEIYRTSLCTLMLEVYYRYLKVGGR